MKAMVFLSCLLFTSMNAFAKSEVQCVSGYSGSSPGTAVLEARNQINAIIKNLNNNQKVSAPTISTTVDRSSAQAFLCVTITEE